MVKIRQFFGITFNPLWIILLIVGSASLGSVAQSSAPTLPPLPSLPALPNISQPITPNGSLPSAPSTNTNEAATTPYTKPIKSSATDITPLPSPTTAAPKISSTTSTPPPLPEASEIKNAEKAKLIPELPSPGLALPTTNTNEAATTPYAKPATSSVPGIAPLPSPTAAASKISSTTSTPPPLPEASEIKNAESAKLIPELPSPGLALPLPGEISPAPTAIQSAKLDASSENGKIKGGATKLDMAAKDKKPTQKSWETVLAPSIIPPVTHFRYKRELLPTQIYDTHYSKENDHLPRLLTREDYEQQLFSSVARNDVETTRALLNAGTGINAMTQDGETPLALAERIGATDVAALIAARGGR